MKFNAPLILKLRSERIIQHGAFWVVVLLILAMIYGVGLPGYWFAVRMILIFMPLHMLYFYMIAYVVMPRYLFTGRYFRFFVFLVLCIFLAALCFRLLEILFADPMIYETIKKQDKTFVWHKLDGTFTEQLLKYTYILNAFEQANFVVWIAVAIKFFKMWYEKQQAALEAELILLKGQLHPHFLFNTLNNLYALTLCQSPRSPSVVIGLSEILRYMLYEANADVVDLKRDVEIVENYIALEKIRYEERLDLNFSIKGMEPGHSIVPLLILPLVENAFKHGTSEKIGDAWISMDLQVRNDTLKFKISNSKPDQPAKPDQEKNHSSIGLANVRKRLEILYPSAHQLRILEEEDIYAVILEINLDKRLKIGEI